MKVLVLCFVAALWLQLPSGGDAVCCRKHSFQVRSPDGVWHKGDVCGDCTMGTPYCSFKGCNIFGCNCGGGCRTGMCDGSKFAHQVRSLNVLASGDAHDVIREADQNGDGMMSIEEARALLVREVLPAHQIKRSLEGNTPVAKEASPANQAKRWLRKNAPLAKNEALPANQVKRALKGHAPLAKEALPADQEKRRIRRKSYFIHLKRSLEAMDINKDNFLSAQEIDSNSE